MIEFKNYDDIVKQDTLKQPRSPYGIPANSRVLMAGSSGGGKTNVLLNILLSGGQLLYYDKLYLYSTSLTQAKYKYLLEKIQEIADDNEIPVTDLVYTADNVADILPLSKLDASKQNCVIFDDMLLDMSPLIGEYFVRGRHKQCTTFFLSQSFFKTDKLIRQNSTYYFLFATNGKNLSVISTDLAGTIEIQVFKKMFKQATKQAYSFMVIAPFNNNKMMRYRHGMDGLFPAEWFEDAK